MVIERIAYDRPDTRDRDGARGPRCAGGCGGLRPCCVEGQGFVQIHQSAGSPKCGLRCRPTPTSPFDRILRRPAAGTEFA
jgi:hypothetical protein